MDVKNRIAVITGGGGGIGAALAKALADKGAKVVVSDLSLEAAQSVAKQVDGAAYTCDVSNEENIQALVEKVESDLGPIDLFCSNAGFGVGEPNHVASASNEVWQKNWDVHVMAHVWASRALLPKMIERGDGYLLNVASAAGLLCQIGDAAYSATKHAAVSLAESLAIGHNGDGVKVSVVCPQYVNTNILMIEEADRGKEMKGVITPEQCAASIVKGIEEETFMILPHEEVAGFYAQRAAAPSQWIDGMKRYRASLIGDDGKFDFRRIFGIS